MSSTEENHVSVEEQPKKVEKLTLSQRLHNMKNQIDNGINQVNKGIEFTTSSFDWAVNNITKASQEYGNIDKDLLRISEKINNNYKYESMLLRTHGAAIQLSGVAIVTYASSYLGRRFMVFGALSSYVMSSTAIYLVDYKWKK